MLLIGEKEAESGEVSVRKRGTGDLGTMSIDGFIEHFHGVVAEVM
jgi:threonyl-tRNA synthetase